MPAFIDFTIYAAKSQRQRDHNEALIRPHGFELAIVSIANGIAEYAMAYRRRHGEPAGKHDPLGGLGLDSLLDGLLTMLGGDTGRLDKCHIDAVLARFARRHRLQYGKTRRRFPSS